VEGEKALQLGLTQRERGEGKKKKTSLTNSVFSYIKRYIREKVGHPRRAKKKKKRAPKGMLGVGLCVSSAQWSGERRQGENRRSQERKGAWNPRAQTDKNSVTRTIRPAQPVGPGKRGGLQVKGNTKPCVGKQRIARGSKNEGLLCAAYLPLSSAYKNSKREGKGGGRTSGYYT